jgi:hypothetical protein
MNEVECRIRPIGRKGIRQVPEKHSSQTREGDTESGARASSTGKRAASW